MWVFLDKVLSVCIWLATTAADLPSFVRQSVIDQIRHAFCRLVLVYKTLSNLPPAWIILNCHTVVFLIEMVKLLRLRHIHNLLFVIRFALSILIVSNLPNLLHRNLLLRLDWIGLAVDPAAFLTHTLSCSVDTCQFFISCSVHILVLKRKLAT